MDADLQDSPDEIPELYRMITEDGYDLVSGWKQKRYDPLSKTIPTKLFNATARAVSGIHNLHDFNCGLKAYRRDVVKTLRCTAKCTAIFPTWLKCRLQPYRRKDCTSSGTQIWKDQVRTEPFRQRLPGFAYLVVLVYLRRETDAHLRLLRLHHVHPGIYRCHCGRCHQTL